MFSLLLFCSRAALLNSTVYKSLRTGVFGYLHAEREGLGTSITWMTIAKLVSDGILASVTEGLLSHRHINGRRHFGSYGYFPIQPHRGVRKTMNCSHTKTGTLSVGSRELGRFLCKVFPFPLFLLGFPKAGEQLPARGFFFFTDTDWFAYRQEAALFSELSSAGE